MSLESFKKEVENGRLGRNHGLSIGLSKLEEITGGLTKSTFTLLFASSGIGKSSAALYSYVYIPLKEHLEDGKIKIIFFALEMKESFIIAKLLSTYLYDTYHIRISAKQILSIGKDYTLPDDIYETIMKDFQHKEINFVVDATKDLLLNVLKYKPFLIKPNHHELGEMFNVELKNKEEIIIYAKKLQEIGARNVIISMAGDGAILIEENGEITISDTPKGTLVNSVGAGDSMVGGFLAGIAEDKNIKEAFKMGVATGSASAFSEGLATKDKVEELLKQL